MVYLITGPISVLEVVKPKVPSAGAAGATTGAPPSPPPLDGVFVPDTVTITAGTESTIVLEKKSRALGLAVVGGVDTILVSTSSHHVNVSRFTRDMFVYAHCCVCYYWVLNQPRSN